MEVPVGCQKNVYAISFSWCMWVISMWASSIQKSWKKSPILREDFCFYVSTRMGRTSSKATEDAEECDGIGSSSIGKN